MTEIIACPHCVHNISSTAIICPACGSRDHGKVSTVAGAAVGGVIAMALAPAEFLTAFFMPGLGGKSVDPQEFAKEHGAIDCFPLGEEISVFVTESSFLCLYQEPPIEELSHFVIDRHSLIEVELVNKKSLLGRNRVAAKIRDSEAQEDVTYIFKGKEAHARASWAKKKFEEYSASKLCSSRL